MKLDINNEHHQLIISACAHCLKHVEWDDGLWANKRVGSNIRHIHRDCWEDFVECEPSDDEESEE